MMPALPGILQAYGPAPPWEQPPAQAGPAQQRIPVAIVVSYQFMHTSTWHTSRILRLGTWGMRPVVQFIDGNVSCAWHGKWERRGDQLLIWWHFSGEEDKVRHNPMVYTIIDHTDSFRRGHGEGVEVLSPFRQG